MAAFTSTLLSHCSGCTGQLYFENIILSSSLPNPQVNSMSVVGMQHSEVVAAIKAGGDETSLLVVDREAEAFFNSCDIIPTEAHLTGTHVYTLFH
jgi:hypothetical protein